MPPRRLLGSSTTTILQPVHPTAPKVVSSCSFTVTACFVRLLTACDLSFQMDLEKARCLKLLTASMMLGVIGRQYTLLLCFVFNLKCKTSFTSLDCPIMPEGASSTNLQPNKDTKKFRRVRALSLPPNLIYCHYCFLSFFSVFVSFCLSILLFFSAFLYFFLSNIPPFFLSFFLYHLSVVPSVCLAVC